MLHAQSASRPEPVASGLLGKRPLAHLLVYALDRKLTGSFELQDDGGASAQIVVSGGLLSRVATSEPVIYLGHVLFENGVIDGDELSASLAAVAAEKRLHGQILLTRGKVNPGDLADALRQQQSRKLQHVFSFSPRATFAFYSGVDLVGERPNDLRPVDPLPAIWRGVLGYPSWNHVRATIATVGGRPLRLTGSTEGLGLDDKERAAERLLRSGAVTVSELVSRSGLGGSRADLLAYFLVITKLAEITEPTKAAAPAVEKRATTDPGVLGPTLPSGEYVRRISFTMRAVSADPHPLRIPSPMPGSLSATGVPRVPSPMPRRYESTPGMGAVKPPGVPEARGSQPKVIEESALEEAEQLLSEAEMHLVLGEREHAVGIARKALIVAPGMAAAMALLAYLEAVGAEAESYLHDLLKMADAALAKEEDCRRGRYYRAEIKKRLGDHEGAIRDLRAALRSDPDDADARRELGIYERKIREGAVVVRSMSPAGGIPRASGFVDFLRGKKPSDA